MQTQAEGGGMPEGARVLPRPVLAGLVLAGLLQVAWAIGLVSGGGRSTLTNDLVGEVAGLVAVVVAAYSCLTGGAATLRRTRRAWRLLGAGGVLWAAGNVALGLLVRPGTLVVSPGAPEVFFVAGWVLVLTGTLAFLVGGHDPGGYGRLVLDAWLAAASVLLVLWTLLVTPLARTETWTGWQVAGTILMPILDTFLLAVAGGVWMRTPAGHRRAVTAGVGVVLLAATAEAAYAVERLTLHPAPGWPVVLLWFAAAVLLAVAPWLDSADLAGTVPHTAVPARTASLPYVATGVAVALVVVELLSGRRVGSLALVVGGLAVLGLVARQGWSLADTARLTRALAVREAQLASMLDASQDVLIVISPAGTIRYVSPAMERGYGYRPGVLIGTDVAALVHPEDLVGVRQRLAQRRDESEPVYCLSVRISDAHGRWVPVEAALSTHPDGFLLNVRDVTERMRLQEQLAHLAFHDVLTGLANRALFVERVEHALSGRQVAQRVAALFLDLDGFKAVNDSLGHAAGDELLVQVAQRLRSVVRVEDTVARLGGDEFAVLVDRDAARVAAGEVAARIVQVLGEPYVVGGHEVAVTASTGMAYAQDGVGVEELLRDADLAMYRAKALGKGQVAVFTPDLHDAAVRSGMRLVLARGGCPGSVGPVPLPGESAIDLSNVETRVPQP
ncbi:MAG: diguanylate cyclase domain-containing protein [Actinomycetes bacterium]